VRKPLSDFNLITQSIN